MEDRSASRSYYPGKHAGWGWSVWKEMASELYAGRELIWRLFLRDFSARYRQTLLGALWVAISPLVMVAAFVALKKSGVVSLGEMKVPYPAYALLGLALWQIFSGGLNAAAASIVSAGSFVAKINFPKETLVVASLGQPLVNAGIQTVTAAAVFAFYGMVPPWTAALMPLAALPLLILALGLGTILAFLNVMIRDIGVVTGMATTALLFLTPVLYADPPAGPLEVLTRINPLAHLIRAPRDLCLQGAISDPAGFALTSAASVAILLLAWRLFHMAEARFTERLGSK